MYEPVVLPKKQSRTIARTPAAKVFGILNSLKIIIPITGTLLFSYYLGNKKKLIAELDEFNPLNTKLNIYEELIATGEFWSAPALRGVTQEVLKRHKERENSVNGHVTLAEVENDKNVAAQS